MLVVLPLSAFLFLLLGFRRLGWRAAFLAASIPWALFVAFLTEFLTQFRDVTRTGLIAGWLIFSFACLAWMWRARRSVAAHRSNSQRAPWKKSDRIVLLAVAAIVALVGLTALASAPNNWDAMEYHLPRVVEWISNRGVQFFPTIDWSQLCQPPFAEYVMLHLDLLSRSDRLLALVPWFSYAGCIVGTTLLVRELGGGRRSQLLAAVLTATIPSAILGASSTKNDCVAAYWIMAVSYYLLRWKNDQSWWNALAIGTAFGLAVFTKGTSYILLPPIFLACFLLWDRSGRVRFLRCLPAVAAIFILICAPLWIRNFRYSGSPLGFTYFYGAGNIHGRSFGTTHVTPTQTAANVLRNIALHAGVPSERINAISTRLFSRAIYRIGVDPNDPQQIVASQLGYTPRFQVRFNPRNEVLSEDPFHLLLFFLAGILLLAHHRKVDRNLGWFGFGIVGAFVMYCALLRWSPWNARYQVPIFVLGAAFSGVALDEYLPEWAAKSIGVLALLLAFPLALMNETRPLITAHGLNGSTLTAAREQTYFWDSHRELAVSWIAAANAAKHSNCRFVGLDANLMHFEYPMMALVNNDGIHREIRYVDVENSSARYARPSAQPVCMVICLNCRNSSAKIAQYSATLPRMQTFGAVMLFNQPEK